MSEGQWQKLNIAKALYNDAPILIFDEPTASLDPVSESALYRQLMGLKGEKTLIMVSHRLGSLKTADKIYMMKDGKILDSGSHSYLIKHCSEYRQMYDNQAQWYRQKDARAGDINV